MTDHTHSNLPLDTLGAVIAVWYLATLLTGVL
jgi:hypothetical protein